MNDECKNTEGAEFLPPEGLENGSQEAPTLNQNNLLAVIANNYTDRPDLLIAEIERQDPGFVKRMNAASEKDAAELRDARFSFGKFQAYTGLGLSVFGAIVLLIGAIFAVEKDSGFWTIIALGLFYAITQGGSGGFMRIVEAIADAVKRFRHRDDDPPPPSKNNQ